MLYLTHTGISSTVFSVLWKVYNNSQAVCFSSNHFPPIQNLFYDFKRAVPKDCSQTVDKAPSCEGAFLVS